MGYTVVPDKAAGDVFTAAMWNTYIAANINTGLVVQLADITLAAVAATITFSSIPQLFSHLMLVGYTRGDQAATNNSVLAQFNGDTGANYDIQYLLGSGGVGSASEALGQTRFQVGQEPAATGTAGHFAAWSTYIPHYRQSDNQKAAFSSWSGKWSNASGQMQSGIISGFWRNAAAITQITLFASAGNLNTGSRVTLYGMP